jgi:hypothetical protein
MSTRRHGDSEQRHDALQVALTIGMMAVLFAAALVLMWISEQ